MLDPRGLWPLALGLVLAAPMGIGAASRWSASLTLGPERFDIPSTQGGAPVDQVPWSGRLVIGYTMKPSLAVRVGTGYLSGSRVQKVTPSQGTTSQVEDRLWGYSAELGLAFPLKIGEGLHFVPGMSLGYFRLHYEERQTIGGAAQAVQSYRLSGFGGVLSAGVEANVTKRLLLLGEVRAGLPLLRESWTEGANSTNTSYIQDVRPSWSGIGLGLGWRF